MNKIFLIFFLCFFGCETQGYAKEFNYYEREYSSKPYQFLNQERFFEELPDELLLAQTSRVASTLEEEWEANRRRAQIGGGIGAVIGAITIGWATSYLLPSIVAHLVFIGAGAAWIGGIGALTGDAWYKR